MKRYWRCFVCNDIHYGVASPELCPTCKVPQRLRRDLGRGGANDTGGRLRDAARRLPGGHRALRRRPGVQGQSRRRQVDLLLQGVAENERDHGLKFCPCRLRTKDWAEDQRLVCPCNFTIHETYKGLPNGECWCGLFVRRLEIRSKLIMFHGRECPHCKDMMPLVERLEKEIPVNVRQARDLARRNQRRPHAQLPASPRAEVRQPAPRPDFLQHGDQGRHLRRGRLREAQGLGAEQS